MGCVDLYSCTRRQEQPTVRRWFTEAEIRLMLASVLSWKCGGRRGWFGRDGGVAVGGSRGAHKSGFSVGEDGCSWVLSNSGTSGLTYQTST